jgi:glutathione S-transferase
MIKIYGSPKSSSGRCYWCRYEVEAEFEAIAIDFKAKEYNGEAYLKINPNEKVPALIDEDFVI